MYVVDTLENGAEVRLEVKGSLARGDFVIAVSDQRGNRPGRFSDVFVSTFAPLLEYGGARMEEPRHMGRMYDPVSNTEKAAVSLVMVVPSLYDDADTAPKTEEKFTGAVMGDPSEELKRLIVYIKTRGLERKYFLALNYDGILYVVDPDRTGGEDPVMRESFGFDCGGDNGFFYLFRQVPDDDPVGIMKRNGIMISRLETLMDSLENEDQDE